MLASRGGRVSTGQAPSRCHPPSAPRRSCSWPAVSDRHAAVDLGSKLEARQRLAHAQRLAHPVARRRAPRPARLVKCSSCQRAATLLDDRPCRTQTGWQDQTGRRMQSKPAAGGGRHRTHLVHQQPRRVAQLVQARGGAQAGGPAAHDEHAHLQERGQGAGDHRECLGGQQRSRATFRTLPVPREPQSNHFFDAAGSHSARRRGRRLGSRSVLALAHRSCGRPVVCSQEISTAEQS